MKALFKLKEFPYVPESMTNKMAEEAYMSSYKYPNRVARGFYSNKLTFTEWLLLYNINII